MAIRTQQIYTTVLNTSTFTIVPEMSIQSISISLVSGVGQFTGTLPLGVLVSSPIPLIANQPVTISSDSGLPLEGIVVDCTAGGVINLIARQ